MKLGVIGIGNIGNVHASYIERGEIEGAELVAVADISEEKVERHNVKAFKDYKELIDSSLVDGVIISTPHPTHAEIATYALEKNVNVLIEKPADISATKVKLLNSAAEKSGKIFSIMFNQRTNPLFKKAKELIESETLGEIKRSSWIITNWFRTQAYYDSGNWRGNWKSEGGGVLINQAPHNLDIWQWLCGMPTKVTAFCDLGKHHNIEVEDEVTIFTRYVNGATGTFISSTGEYPGTNRLEITLDRGKIVIEEGVLKLWKLKDSVSDTISSDKNAFRKIDFDYEEIKDLSTESGHKEILQNFVNAVLKSEKLIANGTEGLNEILISNAAYLSSWTGETVNIPFDFEEFDKRLFELSLNSTTKSITSEKEINTNYNKRWRINW